MQTITWSEFEAVEIRVGTVVAVDAFTLAAGARVGRSGFQVTA